MPPYNKEGIENLPARSASDGCFGPSLALRAGKMGMRMANLHKRVSENISGDLFVDSTCIDCDTCRQLAPAVFGEADDHVFVQAQPAHELEAYPDYCWYSWPRQVASMRRLAEFAFEWVLPGHGQRVHLPREEMRRQMQELVERMRKEDGKST
jgi:4Fe-4S single cluster domain of Ferredoxin I